MLHFYRPEELRLITALSKTMVQSIKHVEDEMFKAANRGNICVDVEFNPTAVGHVNDLIDYFVDCGYIAKAVDGKFGGPCLHVSWAHS